MSAKRIEWVDRAKGIGLLFVMLCHCYWIDRKYEFWFFPFMIAIFFFTSGYTYTQRPGFLLFLKKKVKSLLVPYVFMGSLMIIFWGILAVTHGQSYDVAGELKGLLVQNRYNVFWFITALFISSHLLFATGCLLRQIKKEQPAAWIIAGIIFFQSFLFIDTWEEYHFHGMQTLLS